MPRSLQLNICLSEIRELWDKVPNTYTECKNYLTAYGTTQVDNIDVVADKYKYHLLYTIGV